MRVTDLVFCFPPIILAMAIAAALGIGTRNTVIAMLVVWWPKFARLARSLVHRPALAGIRRGRASSALARHTSCSARSCRTRSARWSCWSRSISATPSWCSPACRSSASAWCRRPPEWGSMVSEGRELVEQWWVATFPGSRHPDRGDRLQLRGRRPARLARSQHASDEAMTMHDIAHRIRLRRQKRAIAGRSCRCATCAPGSSPMPAWCARSMASASRSAAARRWASSANPAPARASPRKSIMSLLEEPARIVERLDSVPRPRDRDADRGRAARNPRRRDRHGLPGPDDLAQSGAAHRAPA